MAASVLAVADGVAALLNEGHFSQPFTALRLYVPTFELQDMANLHISVVPAASTRTRASRATIECAATVAVTVQQRVADQASATLDGLVALAEEIADFLAATPLADGSRAREVILDPVYAEDLLIDLQQFSAVVQVIYPVWE